jgi:hypothetical protein
MVFFNTRNLISLQSFEDGSTWKPLSISSSISCGNVCSMNVLNSWCYICKIINPNEALPH